jgi:hypothetical protein
MPCEARFYCPEGTSPASRRDGLCLPGFYCPSGTPAGSSFPCPAGAYCEEGSKDPTPCPIGTFHSELGAVSAENCTKCPLGTYGTQTLASSPQACVTCPIDRPLTKRTGAESESDCYAPDVCSQTALAVLSTHSQGGYRGSQLELQLNLKASTAVRAELTFTPQKFEIRRAMTEVQPSAGAVQTFAANLTLASAGNFSVRYSVDGQVCTASAALGVACEAGYDSVGDQCVKVEMDSFCSSTMSVRSAKTGRLLDSRKLTTIVNDDALMVSFERGANVSFQMLPLKDAYKDSAAASQSSITLPMAGKVAGMYSVLAMRNGKPCSVVDVLTMQCQPGYEPNSI